MELHNCKTCGLFATRKKVDQQVVMKQGYTITTEDYYCKEHAPTGSVLITDTNKAQISLAAFMDVPLVKDLKGVIRPEKKAK